MAFFRPGSAWKAGPGPEKIGGAAGRKPFDPRDISAGKEPGKQVGRMPDRKRNFSETVRYEEGPIPTHNLPLRPE
jgi:hypothetical protein